MTPEMSSGRRGCDHRGKGAEELTKAFNSSMVSKSIKRLLSIFSRLFCDGKPMLLPRLREEVLEANLDLVRAGLVLYTFGNSSGISREEGLVVIKPSGVPYDEMKPEHLVVTDLTGKIVEGTLRPSSDLPTHIVIYQS